MSHSFYRITPAPFSDHFANAEMSDSSFLPCDERIRCKKCGRLLIEPVRAAELVVEWPVDQYNPVTNQYADFYSIGGLLISRKMRDVLEASGLSGFSFGPVRMMHRSSVKTTAPQTIRVKTDRYLAYDGDDMFELKINGRATLDYTKNEADITRHVKCKKCGDIETIILFPWPHRPLAVSLAEWDGSDFFDLVFPGTYTGRVDYCVTERARDVLLGASLSNLLFELAGSFT